jgi:signal transduction histidine kinase
MTAGIAHELRNPLNFVNSFSELSAELAHDVLAHLAAMQGRPDSQRLDQLQQTLGELTANLGRVKEHGKRMEGIIRSMLEHSRGGKGERHDTDLTPLLTSSINLAWHGMRSREPAFHAELDLDIDPALGTVNVVPQEISRVIVNVLDNACHAVNAKRQAEGGAGFEPRIRVSARREGSRVEIRVHDNGSGIPVSIRDRIFTPFFTTKKAGEGTGLGMSLSHDIIVKGHGGTLHFESEEGAYTELIITLPG